MSYHRGYEIEKLVIKYKLERIAEIGIYNGRGMRKVLRNEEANKIIKEYWAIDPYKPLPHYLELGENHRSIGRHGEDHWKMIYLKALSYEPFFPQLKVIKLTSKETTTLFPKRFFPNGYFDLVFIDDDHEYEAVKNGIEAWYPLVKEGGILCGHDYCSTGKDKGYYKDNVIKAVDERFGSDIEIIHDVWVHRK